MNQHIVIQNVYYMLSYAFEEIKFKNYEDLKTETFNNIYELYAAILLNGIGKLVKQGLYRTYQIQYENLPRLRGKVDIQGTMQNALEKKRLLCCKHDEFTENNLYNQILKGTVVDLLRGLKDQAGHEKISKKRRIELKKLVPFFSNVDLIPLDNVQWSNLYFDRGNQSYRLLIGICQLVFQEKLLSTQNGRQRLASFEDGQNYFHLYEKFILNYYRKEHPEIHASAPYVAWALDNSFSDMLPTMKTDVTLSKNNRTLIIDAKYYAHNMQQQYGVDSLRSAHLYQIFAYVKNRQALANNNEIISGMLLYAKTDASIQPDGVYHMSGNQISVKTLDLNQTFDHIRRQLDQIVEDFFG